MQDKSQQMAECLKSYGQAHAFEVQNGHVVVIDPYLDLAAPTSFGLNDLHAAVRDGRLVKLIGSIGSDREVYGISPPSSSPQT